MDDQLEKDVTQDDPVVKTKPFALTPKAYFRILLRITYRKAWWMIATFTIIAFCSLGLRLIDDEGMRHGGFLGFVVFGLIAQFYLFWPLYKCRNMAYNPANKVVMKTSTMTLSKKQIICNETESGSVGIHPRADFFGIEKCRSCYLIWLTPDLLFYLAKDAFQSQEDLEIFEKEILPAYPEHKRSLINGIFYMFVFLACGVVFGLIVSVLHKT